MSRHPRHSLNPILSKGIIAIILVILAALIILSFFGQAGAVGIIIDEYVLSFLFGQIRYATPLIILVLAWFLVRDIGKNYRATHLIGAILFFLATAGLFHLSFPPDQMWQQALDGHGGGIFGLSAWVLKSYLGTIAGGLILVGLMLVSLLLMFNTAIVAFVMFHKKFFSAMGILGQAIIKGLRLLFVPNKLNEEKENFDQEDYTTNEDDDELDLQKRKFMAKNIKTSDEDDTEVEVDSIGTIVSVKEKEFKIEDGESKKGVPDAAYLRNVVIKKIPPISLLSERKGKPTSGDIKENARIITDTFHDFKIDVEVEGVRVGPTVTQYALRVAPGVKLSRIIGLSNNLALNLAAHPIRIEAPIPGKSLVGIEVPNEKVALVTLRELIESNEFMTRPHNLMLALGKDVAGKVWFVDLPRLPHLLIAGATGSGKTVCINTILLSLLYQNTAETLRLILIDPKRVELTMYNGIPHLLTPVITNTQKTVSALKWTIGEMERRFEVFSEAGNRDITSYNQKHPDRRLPHIVFVIDELADLMATAASEVEAGIIRLAQMARAVGIHIIVATQRPSVDVITGLMKANIPGRIAFSVASLMDSRTILDASGAEKLLGRGDMLLQTAELTKPVRIQDAFVSEEELQNVIQYLQCDKEEINYDESILEKPTANGGTVNMFGGSNDDQDPFFEDARRAIIEAGKASASLLQRRLKIGYARAARILDELEEAGIIGPGDGAKPRELLAVGVEINPTMDAGGELNVFDGEAPVVDEVVDEVIEESVEKLD